ncbi:MAG: hypothetical protein OQK73_11410 [Gammaproteobacteria bacterium]|nr:hypothetical protein [Gammaproteobacteria bacterium]
MSNSNYHNLMLQINKTGRHILLVLGCYFLLLPNVHATKIKCWVNSDNVRECGSVVPPEYSQQRIEILNERGIIIEVKDAAKTKEQLEEEARLARIEEAKQRRIAEQKRKDQILLQTYTTERDLKLSNDSKVDAIKSIIDITNSNTRSLQKNLEKLQKQAADYERSSLATPKPLLNDMDDLLRQINDNNDFIEKKDTALEIMDRKFKRELRRFRDLKKGKIKYE